MKKSIYDFMKFDCYRYAPESFRLFLDKKEIQLPYQIKTELGNVYICKGIDELEKHVKRFFRKYSNMSQSIQNVKIAIELPTGGYATPQFMGCKRDDIKGKLHMYKAMKRQLEKDGYAVAKVQTAIITVDSKSGKFKAEKVKNGKAEADANKTIKRIKFIKA